MTDKQPALLSRDSILKAKDQKHEDVHIPEWGGTVRVKALNGAERDKFEASIAGTTGKRNLANVRAKLVAMAVVDLTGQPLFNQTDVVALGGKSASALDKVFAVAQRLAGITEADIEEYEENFS
jgi:hypothetical protein